MRMTRLKDDFFGGWIPYTTYYLYLHQSITKKNSVNHIELDI